MLRSGAARSMLLVVALGSISASIPVSGAPLVTSITPEEAEAGDQLAIKGSDLKGTRKVLFVSGSTMKNAKFKVVSDSELDVTFPEYYRGSGSATLIIIGSEGATVGMSEKFKMVDVAKGDNASQPFPNELLKGTLNSGGGIVVVAEDGILSRSHQGAVCLVKRGGTVSEFHGHLILHEAEAKFASNARADRSPPALVKVKEITVSPRIEPVTIKTPQPPQPFARHPPELSAITSRAAPGDIIDIRGKHLERTTQVLFYNGVSALKEAGFKAINDGALRVEVPQLTARRHVVMVVNPAGMATNICRNALSPVAIDPRQGRQAMQDQLMSMTFQVEYVGPNQVWSEGSGGRIIIIDKGGTLTQAGGACLFLVLNGGRLAYNPNGSVLHEDDAQVPTVRPKPGSLFKNVGAIRFSSTPLNFDITP